MYQILSLIIGILVAFMVSFNGNLTEQYGIIFATVIIHVIGSLVAFILCSFQKEKKTLWGYAPKWIYLGGAIGVLTTVCNNLAFGYICVTSIVALGLLGQTITALVIDSLGLFGMKKIMFKKASLPGFFFALVGIILMLDISVLTSAIAIFVSLCAGATVVLSRTVNAQLADKVGALQGSLINHLVGLLITIIIAIVVGKGMPIASTEANGFKPWIYLGGVMGVVVVLLFNITVPRLPAFRLTILTFISQIFTGIILDLFVGNKYSDKSFIGGIVIAAGIVINLISEQAFAVKERERQKYWQRIKEIEDEHRKYIFEKYRK